MTVSVGGPGLLVGAQRPRPAPAGLPGLVRLSARRAPASVAVRYAGAELTYDQLETRSDELAERLRGAGGRPGDVAGVCLHRGFDLVISLLAVLKAGMVYLPLDVDDPPRRRAQLLGIARATLALVNAETEELARDIPGVRPIRAETAAAALGAARWAPTVDRAGDHPVYVLFTSGSTGAPKGVRVGTAALVNRLVWMNETFGIHAGDRILQKTPYTFDVSGWEFWCPLIAGAVMVLLPPGEHLDPGRVAEHVADHGVTLCHFVPSMLAEFVRWPAASLCGSLRAVFVSGEELTPGHVRRFRQVSRAELHNLYGPTEAAIDVSWYPCPPGDEAGDRVLIGGPISNCVLLVIGDDGGPADPGAVGELAIGGVPLAHGYVGDSALTEQAFRVAPPWAPVTRIYLTGDLVRQRPEGLEFLGRRDNQVKIRGQRVELSAVEDALREVTGVLDAAVTTVRRGVTAELAALLVLEPDSGGAGAVQAAVRAVLPPGQVPTLLLETDRIPLSSSGKQDRRAVRSIVAAVAAEAAEATPDDDAARWWLEATGSLPSAGTGFLAAGGHSLAAARLAGLIERHRGLRLPLRALLRDDMSLTDLRQWLVRPPREARTGSGAGDSPAAVSAVLSPHQHGLWVWSQMFADYPAYNVTAVLEVDGVLDRDRLWNALDHVVRGHRPLRETFHRQGDQVLRRLHERGCPRMIEGSTATVVTDVLDQHFRADRLPRIAAGIRRGPGTGDVLAVAVDHLVADQRSLDVLLTELAHAYAHADETWPERADEVTPVDAGRRERDLRYWSRRLADAPPLLPLPFALDSPATRSLRGASVDLSLGEAASAAVRRFCADARVTPFALVLRTYARLLARWAGVDDLVVGVPMSGRETPRQQSAVGFHMRTVPIRLRFSDGDLDLAETADALVDGAEHAAVSFEEIVERLARPRDLTNHPVFQVWCNDVSEAASAPDFGGIPARLTDPPARWSLFDLGLYLARDMRGDLRLRLVHRSDRWTPATAEAFLVQCADDLLRTVGADPLRRPGPPPPPPPPPPPEPRRTATDLVDSVLAHGVRHPERPAVTGADVQLTYAEVRRRALQISAALRRTGIGIGEVVAVAAHRSPDLAPVLLGCWHAGAAPLLLDGDAPAGWRADALSAAGATGLIDLAPGRYGDAAASEDPVIATDSRWWSRAPEANAAARALGPVGHLLLTSGTTGAPTTVRLPADALVPALDGYRDMLGLTPDDVFAFTVPPAHDPVFRDLLLPLMMGAQVHVPAPDRAGAHQLVPWLAETAVTVLHLTPAQAVLLAAARPGATLPTLRRVVFHGDVLRYDAVAAMRRLGPAAELYNLYGTTETPQASGLRRIEAAETGTPGERVPIAATAPYRSISVLGPGGPDRIGVLGEIEVRGAGLQLDGSRPASAFRTGDLGRRRPDGLVDVVGRADRQVSVRGHRVSLDGVEAVIRAVAGVRDARVSRSADGSRLLAWWTGGAPATGTAVAAAVSTRLPEAARPAEIHQVETLPMTARGKVDDEALRRGANRRPSATPPFRSGDQVLDRLLQHLTRLRAGTPIGPDDDFFSAGLNSLALLSLHEVIGGDFGDRVRLADLFRFPTARRLAEYVASPAIPGRREPARSAARASVQPDHADEVVLRRAARRTANRFQEKDAER